MQECKCITSLYWFLSITISPIPFSYLYLFSSDDAMSRGSGHLQHGAKDRQRGIHGIREPLQISSLRASTSRTRKRIKLQTISPHNSCQFIPLQRIFSPLKFNVTLIKSSSSLNSALEKYKQKMAIINIKFLPVLDPQALEIGETQILFLTHETEERERKKKRVPSVSCRCRRAWKT